MSQLTAIDVFIRWHSSPSSLARQQSSRHAFRGPDWRLPPSTGCESGRSSATTPRIRGQRLCLSLGSEGDQASPDPFPLAHHNAVHKRFRGTILHHPPGVLVPGLPSPAPRLDSPTPGRSRRLTRELSPPSEKPRRLHPSSDPRQPQERQGSMRTIKRRAHPSPQRSVRKNLEKTRDFSCLRRWPHESGLSSDPPFWKKTPVVYGHQR